MYAAFERRYYIVLKCNYSYNIGFLRQYQIPCLKIRALYYSCVKLEFTFWLLLLYRWKTNYIINALLKIRLTLNWTIYTANFEWQRLSTYHHSGFEHCTLLELLCFKKNSRVLKQYIKMTRLHCWNIETMKISIAMKNPWMNQGPSMPYAGITASIKIS